jgi:plasmid stabilization system protein ParE
VFKVIVSPRAWRDFFEIFDYIRQDSPEAAGRFCNALLEHAESLASFPHIGAPVLEFPRVRFALHTPIRIYYKVNEKRQCVEIIHFWHTSRRPPKM